jgi:molecular chaperone DnaK
MKPGEAIYKNAQEEAGEAEPEATAADEDVDALT